MPRSPRNTPFIIVAVLWQLKPKSNLIGWRQTLTTSPANHIHFLLIRAKKRQVKDGVCSIKYCIKYNPVIPVMVYP
jgi:hypothetical protein